MFRRSAVGVAAILIVVGVAIGAGAAFGSGDGKQDESQPRAARPAEKALGVEKKNQWAVINPDLQEGRVQLRLCRQHRLHNRWCSWGGFRLDRPA